jgi:alkylhydroperoxidase family enzyme
MSRLRLVPGKILEDLLAAAPGALEADREMRRRLTEALTPRLYSLIVVTVAGMLGCQRFVDDLRGPLEKSVAYQAADDWTKLPLTQVENAVLSYTRKGTLDEASVRKSDVDLLRSAGLADKDILMIATTIAYYNYSIRMAAAFDVIPQ